MATVRRADLRISRLHLSFTQQTFVIWFLYTRLGTGDKLFSRKDTETAIVLIGSWR